MKLKNPSLFPTISRPNQLTENRDHKPYIVRVGLNTFKLHQKTNEYVPCCSVIYEAYSFDEEKDALLFIAQWWKDNTEE